MSVAPREWSEYSSTAFCVPSDVCAVDVAGATKGTKGRDRSAGNSRGTREFRGVLEGSGGGVGFLGIEVILFE